MYCVFQSPCAGNMFGKFYDLGGVVKAHIVAKDMFQSPCAGNMFGKERRGARRVVRPPLARFNPRVRGTCLVRPPKALWPSASLQATRQVSIPVCGEHVW